jgi:hypothetical protein
MLETVRQNESPGRLQVSTLTNFPLSGEVFIDYGNNDIEGPINYIAVEGQGPYYIVLNKAYVFKKTHHTNAVIRLSRSNRPIVLDDNGAQHPVYLTGVTKARQSIETILKQIAATGVKINITTRPPPLRYIDTSIDPWSDNTSSS